MEHSVADEVAARLRTEDALRQSQKLEAIGQLTGGVAHDFNNLLTVIRGSAEMLRRPNLADSMRRHYLDAIADTADRAARLTGQLLAFARRQALRPEVLDVGRRIEALAGILQTALGPRIALVNSTDCEVCFAEVDPSQLETAMINMAVNARDAMAGEGVLTISLRPVAELPAQRGHAGAEGRFVAISVADTGVGIESERLDQIFEPFFTTKAVGKGTGLGLSQVYGFAKQSGGDVGVTSTPGKGAVFTMFLPRVEKVETAPLPEHVEVAQLGGEGHVLVVEDNEQVGTFSTQMLEEVGFATTWVSSGEAALKKPEEASDLYSVVFSDVVMPGMNGIQLAREVRARLPRLPIVLTSGYSQVLAQEGSHGFELLQKPYSVDELSKALHRATRRRAAPSNEV